tara:strand:- start:574 stop:1320 length:747 start_codon:yes stop_codon:yes gene_type:complete
MSDIEQDGVVPPPDPVNVTVDEPAPAPAPAPEPAPQPEPGDVTYDIDIDGRTETVNDEEYQYLAKLGAQSLMAAQQNTNTNPYENEPVTGVEESVAVEEEYEDPNDMMDRRMSNLEQQVYNQRMAGQVDQLKGQVDAWMQQDQTMHAIGSMDDGANLLNEVRKEVYNKVANEQFTPDKAYSQVTQKWAKIMGTDRSDYLIKKLRERNAAQPEAGGGAAPVKSVPFTSKDWSNGTLADSISERLTNSDS